MIIFNHPVFPGQFHGFPALDRVLHAPRYRRSAGCSASKRRLIKPNRTELPTPLDPQSLIEKITPSPAILPYGICREGFPAATITRTEKMTDWSIAGWVVLAVFGVAALVVALIDRAQKAVDLLKFDTERL